MERGGKSQKERGKREKDEGRPFVREGKERRKEKTDKIATEGGNTGLGMNNRLLSTLHPSASLVTWRTYTDAHSC